MSQIVNGTYYHDQTPASVIRILEDARDRGLRLRLHFGDTASGRDWMDTHDVAGAIGRSWGPVKVPLLINNARSSGGPAFLDHCIVRIRYANRAQGGDLYRHPTYHIDETQVAGWPDAARVLAHEFA
jgi:hypothetical protein